MVVMGEGYTLSEAEDQRQCTVSALWLLCGRYRIPVKSAPAGALVLVEGTSVCVCVWVCPSLSPLSSREDIKSALSREDIKSALPPAAGGHQFPMVW